MREPEAERRSIRLTLITIWSPGPADPGAAGRPGDTTRRRGPIALATAVAVTAVLAGCTTPYVPEPDRPTAMLRFRSDDPYVTQLTEVDTRPCPAQIHTRLIAQTWSVGPGSEGEVSMLRMLGTAPGKEPLIRERLIAAGRPLLLHAYAQKLNDGFTGGYQCGIGVSFTPRAGEQYDLLFSNLGRRCTVYVERLVAGPQGGILREPVPDAKLLPAGTPQALCGRSAFENPR